MSVINLRKEERLGLAVAVAAHLFLVVVLAMHALRAPPKVPIPQRMTVSLSEDVGPVSTAPNPNTEAQAAIAPTLSEQPAPAPEPQQRVEPPRPTPVPIPPKPVAQPKPLPKPAPKPVAQPKPQPKVAPQPKPAPQPAAKPNPKPAPQPTAKPAGGSRIGDDFLKGTSAGNRTKAPGNFAAAFGPTEKASLASAISRQLRPHWTAPQGVDVELLVTIVRFRLNPDGSLAGEPQVVSQSGRTDANAAQMGRHAELAIRAVKLAAPFNLPKEYYQYWKSVHSRFDRNLSR